MGSHRQRFLHDLPTFVAFLRGETRVHSDHLMTSSLSLLFKDSEECAPTSVHDALCQGMILYHVENSQLLNRDQLIAFCILFGCLIVKVSALTGNLEMGLCRTTGGLTASVTYCLSWMECQRFGFLKRGKPTSGMPNSRAARKRLSDLERRSASICTVVAGTYSPPRPLNCAVKSYLLGNVPSCSYCCFI